MIIIQIGSDKAHINGEEVKLDAEASIVNNSTMVPLRFVSEALGGDVSWDANSRTAIITSAEAKVKENPNAYLREALKTRNIDEIRVALEAGADDGFSMMNVFLYNDLELLKLFMEYGFDINQDFGAPENSMTFTFDTNHSKDEFAIFALENGLMVTNDTLYKAIARNSLEVTRYLLENKLADPNISPTFMSGKNNAYLYAISWGYHDIAEMLLQYGAKKSID